MRFTEKPQESLFQGTSDQDLSGATDMIRDETWLIGREMDASKEILVVTRT